MTFLGRVRIGVLRDDTRVTIVLGIEESIVYRFLTEGLSFDRP
jgi:hypothetical protein